MDYRVLGPLEVRDGEGLIALGGAKQRALLALLLLNANRVVTRERLIDQLWGDEPPESVVTMVQGYVSRLRKLLPEATLLTRARGYVLEVEPESVDLLRFERLFAEARNAQPEHASRRLREALALWRGSALAEFEEPFARVEGGRLEDLRLAALEERIEADLALGREAVLIGELEALIAEQPHRERLRGQLMLALYRCGRQAHALAAYQDARRESVELGIEPGAGLKQLERRILAQDVTLLSPSPTNRSLPSGTVTFLFTDVEGSTRLLDDLGAERYAEALSDHRRIVREAVAAHDGEEVDTQGDAFFVAFPTAPAALAAAAELRAGLVGAPLAVRIGIHTGTPHPTDEGYVGIDVHRAARIAAAGHGDQVLMSASTAALVGRDGLLDLGEHWLKDLSAPERIYQLGHEEFPPLKSLYRTNLPGAATPFVGRTQELADVLDLVRAERLVTLTGVGGSGKSRLALETARELLDGFEDGVWFVSLASLTHSALVEATIAQTLGARGELNHFLRGKQLLLLLDNLEQLLPEVAPIIAGLEAKVLATSRDRLNLAAEHEYAVPTLPLEDAVALFTQRVRQLKPRFEPDEHVTEIARRLDGLPLALELAAARVKILTPKQIVQRLGKGLDLLSGGGRDRPERQRTLRATLDWSYDLLNEEEQRTFARLGIFASSFDLDMAEAVGDADIDALQLLVDKSLIHPSNENRFTMLDTLRTFASEHLDLAELETLRGRQFELLEALAERSPFFLAASTFSGEEQLVWLDQVEPTLPDIRQVLAWALSRDPARTGLLICRLSVGFLLRGGGPQEARTWLERLLQERSALPDEILAEALARLGDGRLQEHDLEAAAAFRRESIDLFRRVGNRMMAAWATNGYAANLRHQGAYTDALALHEQALADFRDLDNPAMVAHTLYGIGDTLIQLGDFDRARETLHRAITTAESYGGDVAFMLSSLAELELEQRNLDDAEALYVRAHDSARDMNDLVHVAYCLAGLACIAALRGDTEDAGERWGRAERTEREIGERLPRRDRRTYEHILEPLANDATFRRGYEAGEQAQWRR